MYIFRRLLKILYYKAKFRNLKLNSSSDIGGLTSQFEGYNVIGRRSFFWGSMGFASYIGDDSRISGVIGRFCSIGNGVNTVAGTHPLYSCISTHPCFYSTAKQAGITFVEKNYFDEILKVDSDGRAVHIGNDVWIGDRVTILGGIHIGDGAVIATGAVVTKNVEPYSIVGGVPAKEIKKRFSREQIIQLLGSRWWEKDICWIKEKSNYFRNVDMFFNLVDNGNEKNESM